MKPDPDLPARVAIPTSLAAAPDFDLYRQHVEHLDLSDAHKDEVLQAVWLIMRSFVDRSFGEDPAQLCRNSVDSGNGVREAFDDAVIDSQPITQFDDEGTIAQAFNEQGSD